MRRGDAAGARCAGKTTLVDCLLHDAGTHARVESTGGGGDGERVMDSGALEKERGITILAKATAVTWSQTEPLRGGAVEVEPGAYRINIMDTPGHADFGGEVERVLSMVDGVCLVVCATEGPMTQTKFVLSKVRAPLPRGPGADGCSRTQALKAGLIPVVVMNKADRDSARCAKVPPPPPDGSGRFPLTAAGPQVADEILDLFVALEANDRQLDYPLLYASAREVGASATPPVAPSLISLSAVCVLLGRAGACATWRMCPRPRAPAT